MSLRFIIFNLLLMYGLQAIAVHEIADEIDAYVSRCNAHIGVAVITERGDTIAVNDHHRYPMNSVMKLYQAMAVINIMDRNRISLDSTLTIIADELHADTWSPLRDRYAAAAPLQLPVRTLIEYSIQQSDNNACDILFEKIIGIDPTDQYIRSLGVSDFAIMADENTMHADPSLSEQNWTYPSVAAALIHKLFTQQLYSPEYQQFLISTLTECATGTNRLPSPLPAQAVIGHKTGTGFNDSAGNPQGINDVGFIRLPDGTGYAIAVFIDRTGNDLTRTEQIIADISAIVLRYMTR